MELLDEKIFLQVIRPRPAESHKGTFGRAVLVGGNQQYGGAIMMAAEACLNAGAGLTTVITHRDNHAPLHARLPEVMVADQQDYALMETTLESADVILIGPGLGLDTTAVKLLQLVLSKQQEGQWLIIDGSALTLFSRGGFVLKYPQQTVFTPHEMEWQRLSKIPIPQQTPEASQQALKKFGTLLVAKSHRTLVMDQQTIYQNTTGNPGMATGGTGDTLAGIIAGFLAQFPKNLATVAAAVYLHSYIGDVLAQENYVVLPTKISAALPYWMKQLENTTFTSAHEATE